MARTWLTTESPIYLVSKYKEYLHGAPYKARKVVLDHDILKDSPPQNIQVVDRFNLLDTFMSTVKIECDIARAENQANLEKIAGIQVRWTSNLADHLALRDDDKKVMLFHQASFLELSKESRRCVVIVLASHCDAGEFRLIKATRTLLKDDLIDETLRTLSLLIPSNNSQSRKWFKRRQKRWSLDSKAGSYTALSASARQIEKFHYWRDRLVVLKQAFDESEPNTIASWWYDDRKKVQWYTFWVAALVLLLTIVFGLIQSISGVVQAWAAVRALHD